MAKRSRKVTSAAFGTGILVAAGVAFAAWTASGTGSGTAESATSVNSTITAGGEHGELFPGSEDLIEVVIDNPNPYPVVVTEIGAGTSAVTAGGCAADTVTSDARGPNAAGLDRSDAASKQIAAGGTGTYTLTVHMAADAADDCKAQSFTLPLTAQLRSDAS